MRWLLPSGYAMTLYPLRRAGMAYKGTAIGLALASDTLSMTTMEVVDNAIMLVVPGAMENTLAQSALLGQLDLVADPGRCRRVSGQPLADRSRARARPGAWASLPLRRFGGSRQPAVTTGLAAAEGGQATGRLATRHGEFATNRQQT
ncbi:MAG: DUF4396 domain-containing protein [Nitrospira sp.]|nr:DUF4396 domain-containing protein [Nitrospira sp.]